MDFKKGQRVRHPTLAAWGIGQVLEDSRGERTRVFFVGAGEKLIAGEHVTLVPVVGLEAAHPVLDNLRHDPDAGIRYKTLPESIQFFLERYPNGFYGESYLRDERDYKVTAHGLCTAMLDEPTLRRLCAAGDYAGVGARAMKLVQSTNIIFPNEKMALGDALKKPAAQKEFALSLLESLYGSGSDGERFEGFARTLASLDANKWTTATYFLYMAKPEHFIFVKPTVVQNAASVCAYEITYKPEPNWLTYSRVLAFAHYLKEALVDLKPRDMIDVQSFMWCIAPDV